MLKSVLYVFIAITTSFPPEKVMICVSKTAYAYHSYACSGLNRCTHEIVKVTLQEAKERRYKPSHICYAGAGAGFLASPIHSKSISGQCQAITKNGTRCSRMARSGGYCWQHGG